MGLPYETVWVTRLKCVRPLTADSAEGRVITSVPPSGEAKGGIVLIASISGTSEYHRGLGDCTTGF